MSEVKVEIRGNASQFGQVAREVKRELEEIKRASAAIGGATDPMMAGANAARERAASTAKIAKEMTQSMMSAATNTAQDKLAELHNASADAVARTTSVAARETAKAISGVKSASSSLGASLLGSFGVVASLGLGAFSLLESYAARKMEIRRIARETGTGTAQVAWQINQNRAMNLPSEVVFGSITNLRQARADALAGEDKAQDAFKQLGIGDKTLRSGGINAMDLFYNVQMAMKDREDREARIAYRRLMGDEGARSLEGWAVGGFFSNERVRKLLNSPTETWHDPGMHAGAVALELNEPKTRKETFRELEPLSTFDVEKRETAERLELANQQTALHLTREALALQKQITAAVAERARLEKMIAGEADPVKKQRAIADALQIEAELMALRKESEKPVGLQANPGGRSDPLRSYGADLSMYGMSRMRDLQAQANRHLAEISRGMRESGLVMRDLKRALE